MNKITNPFILPTLITIIVPLIWYILVSNYGDLTVISLGLGIVDAILIIIQGWIWYTIFQKRKGTPKIFKNALNAKNYFKFWLGVTAIFLIMLLVTDYLIFNAALNEKNIPTLDQTKNPLQKYRINNAVFLSVMGNVLALLSLMFVFDRNYGQSYAYFRIAESEKKEFLKIAQFQKGMRFYDEHLSVTFDLRLKNMDQIQSVVIFDKQDKRNDNIQKLIASFTDDQLDPARFLGEISHIEPNEFFHKQTDFERFEKYVKILSQFVPIIGLVVTLVVNLLQK